MSFTALGDLAQTALLRRTMTQVKARMTTLSQEVTTGVTTDAARHLGGNLGPLDAIRGSLDRLAAFKTTAAEMELRGSTMQTALQTISSGADDLATPLIGAAADEASLDALGARAESRLSMAVAALNTSVGGRAVFSGTAADTTPLIGADEILSRLETLTAGLGTVADVTAAVDGWFTDPAGFAAEAYRGTADSAEVMVAEGESVSLAVTALDPGLRDTLKGFALAALAARDVPSANGAARAGLMQAAGEALLSAQPARADLRSTLGSAEERIANAQTRNSAETSALEMAQTAMLAVDDYDSATRLTEAETQLNLIYALTARLGALSLSDYIR